MTLVPDWRRADTARFADPAVDAVGVRKIYPRVGRQPPVEALTGVDIRIPRGSIFGLLGPNGAGKSTFINILAGLVRRTAGEVRIWGYDIDKETRLARASIGIVPQELNMDPFFTASELLEVQAGYYGVPQSRRRTRELLDIMGLSTKAEVRGRFLSGGQQRRLMMAKAMVHDPPVLVLDEPTAGVDIELRQQIYNYIRDLRAGGTTILLTTHYLEEAEKLCDRIAIINEGRVVACDTTEALLRRMDHKELLIRVDRDLDTVPAALARFGAMLDGRRRLVFHYGRSQHRVTEILDAVRGLGLEIIDLSTHESDLEDIFLLLTRRSESAPRAAAQ